jgi:hypothetical protein
MRDGDWQEVWEEIFIPFFTCCLLTYSVGWVAFEITSLW